MTTNRLPPYRRPATHSGAVSTRGTSSGAFESPGSEPWSVRSRMKLMLVIALYVASLMWAYATVVSPEYAYEGFVLIWPSALQMAWLITLVLLPALFLPYSFSRPSALILWWLYLAVYIPATIVPAITLSMPAEKLLPLQISLLLCMGLLGWTGSGPRLLAIKEAVVSPTMFWPTFLFIWGACIAYVVISGRVSSLVSNVASLFAGADEYTIRGKYRDVLMEAGNGLGYVVGQLSQAFNPFLIAFGLTYRRRMCLIAGIVGQIIVFSLTGFKAALMSVFLLLFVATVKHWRSKFGLAVTSGLIAIVLAATVLYHATGSLYGTTVTTRRALLTPGLVTGFYFEHYSQIPPVGLGIHFFRDERVLTPPNEIGFAYFGDVDVNANANLWAEGFAEAGLPGILLFTIITAFSIWIYDSIAAGRDPAMALLLLAMPAATLSNTQPTTVLVTHGGLAAALLLYLSPCPRRGEATEPEVPHGPNELLSTADTLASTR